MAAEASGKRRRSRVSMPVSAGCKGLEYTSRAATGKVSRSPASGLNGQKSCTLPVRGNGKGASRAAASASSGIGGVSFTAPAPGGSRGDWNVSRSSSKVVSTTLPASRMACDKA